MPLLQVERYTVSNTYGYVSIAILKIDVIVILAAVTGTYGKSHILHKAKLVVIF